MVQIIEIMGSRFNSQLFEHNLKQKNFPLETGCDEMQRINMRSIGTRNYNQTLKLNMAQRSLSYLCPNNLLTTEQRKPNEICFGTENYNDIKGITKSEFVKILDNLERDGLISTHFYGHHDTSAMCEITILSGGLHYFENKKSEQKSNRRANGIIVREWITIVISVIALILSAFSIYLQYQ